MGYTFKAVHHGTVYVDFVCKDKTVTKSARLVEYDTNYTLSLPASRIAEFIGRDKLRVRFNGRVYDNAVIEIHGTPECGSAAVIVDKFGR